MYLARFLKQYNKAPPGSASQAAPSVNLFFFSVTLPYDSQVAQALSRSKEF